MPKMSAKEKAMAQMSAPEPVEPPTAIEQAKKNHRMSIHIEFEDKTVDGKSVTSARVDANNYGMGGEKKEEYTDEAALLACIKEHWAKFNKAVGSKSKTDGNE